jgi:polyhydroxyalkanoate synthesis regulator phasin
MPKITDRALELGLYLPLGAYSKAREGLSDLTTARVRKLVDEFVDRGEERTQAVTKVVRRRANKVEDVAEKTTAKVQKQAKKTVKKASAASAPATAKLPRVAAPKNASELPIASYNSLTASEILTELKGLTQTQLAKVYKFEKANEGRATILEAIDSRLTPLPIATYDALTDDEINGRLANLNTSELKTLRRYETDTKNRATVLDKIDALL